MTSVAHGGRRFDRMNELDPALRRTAPALVIALLATIAGGVVSAATAHSATQPASWAAAYLVLVGGVATFGLALGRGLLAHRPPADLPAGRLGLELGAWVAGNALVLGGNLGGSAVLLALGSALLVLALVLVVAGTRPHPSRSLPYAAGPAWVRWLFTAIVVVIAVSIPIGNVLASR